MGNVIPSLTIACCMIAADTSLFRTGTRHRHEVTWHFDENLRLLFHRIMQRAVI